jgi:hypothetical protein
MLFDIFPLNERISNCRTQLVVIIILIQFATDKPINSWFLTLS